MIFLNYPVRNVQTVCTVFAPTVIFVESLHYPSINVGDETLMRSGERDGLFEPVFTRNLKIAVKLCFR